MIATSRKATITTYVLEQYKELIINTIIDLENHLQEIDDKLQKLSLQKLRLTDENILHQQHLEEKRSSTRQYLRICAEIAKHMNQLHLSIQKFIHLDISQAITFVLESSSFVKRIISAIIEECERRFVNTTCELKIHLYKVNSRLKSCARINNTINEEIEKKQIQEEKNCIEQYLDICAEIAEQTNHARTNVVEDISSNHEFYQVIVAILKDLIAARRVVTRDKSTQ